MSQGERLNSQALIRPIAPGESVLLRLPGDANTQAVDAEYGALLEQQGLTMATVAQITEQVLSGALPVEEAQKQLASITAQADRQVMEVYRGAKVSDETAGRIVHALIDHDPYTGEIAPSTVVNLQKFTRASGEIAEQRPLALMHLTGPELISVANLAHSGYLLKIGEYAEAMGGDQAVAPQMLTVEGDFEDGVLNEVIARIDDLCMETTFTADEVAFIHALMANPELVARVIALEPDIKVRLNILQGY